MTANSISPAAGRGCYLRPSPTKPSHRILVVDDDESIRQLNVRVLLHSGYHVDAAEDGAVAWQALNAGSYDLLIADHNMPNMTGVELIEKLYGARMALPVIMATGAFPEEEFIRQPWLQPAATLLKPYTVEELLHAVEEILHLSETNPGSPVVAQANF